MATNVLIVDFHETMPYAKEMFRLMSQFEHDEDEIMECLISYLSDECLADQGLDAYTERITEEHALLGSRTDGELMAAGALALGQQLYETLKRARVYDNDGWTGALHFDGWRDRNRTVAIFKRDPEEERLW
jgi:hypothetical protein